MKTILSMMCLSLATCGLLASTAQGQVIDNTFPSGVPTAGAGVTPFQAALPTTLPGRMWIGTSLADNGFGYSGSYGSVGGKVRLFEDFFDGRWMAEGRGHVSFDRGNFFTNVGIERVFSISAAGSDVAFGVWYDFDGDRPGNFSQNLHQVAFSAAIEQPFFDIYGNGYLPVGNTQMSEGDPTGASPFLRNSLVVQPGIDSALEGWDANLRVRPAGLGMVNGNMEVGLYQYQSDLVEQFLGVRVRAGFQLLQGMITQAEINYDDRFDLTGSIAVGWAFGGGGPLGSNYAGLGRDLERTDRPDHITRFQQDLLLAINPDTGTPYVVWHVDNAAAAGGDGSFENRFNTLAAAQAASGADNIIFVHDGNGTTLGQNAGIVLKPGQFLLGDGLAHTIPVVGGTFTFSNDLDGVMPTISAINGIGVTLASDNTVRGLMIDGTGANMSHGIFADGTGTAVDNGIIEDVTILGSPTVNGINLNGISGVWSLARNDISTAGSHGVFIDNVTDQTARFTFNNNTISNNTIDGIHMEDYDGRRFRFNNNTISGNGRDGVRMERFGNASGNGGQFLFSNHTGTGNSENGVTIIDADGNFEMVNSTLTGNFDDGLFLQNFTNTVAGHQTFIGTTGGGTSTFNNNGTGSDAGIAIDLNAGTQTVNITDTTLNGNGIGVNVRSNGVGTVLNVNLIDNLAMSNNLTDAVRGTAAGGSTLNLLVQNAAGSPLSMLNNGANAGFGIALFSEDGGANTSVLNATIRNITMANTGGGNVASGVLGSVQGNAQMNFLMENATLNGNNSGDAILFDFDSTNAAISSVTIRNATVTGSTADAVSLDIAANSRVDVILQDMTLTGGTEGIDIDTSGTSMLRALIDDNTITGMTFDGVDINLSNTSQGLITLTDNDINNNGPGLNAAADPYFDGVNIAANDNSRLGLTMDNNQITANQEFGVDLQTTGNGQIDVLMTNNTISNNDTGTASPNVNDFQAVNGAAGTICLAMSTNFFALSANVVNNNAPANFTVELDGASNGPGVPNFVGGPGNFNIVPFGTTCQANITALEGVFNAAGFP